MLYSYGPVPPTSFEWDKTKAEQNARKHGITFDQAKRLFHVWHVVRDTDREQDGEAREIAYGQIDGQNIAVVFVMRGETCRIISARRTEEEHLYPHRWLPP